MIEIDGITVEFGRIRPLDNLSARLGAPINGLIGPNGAGKTTLLNVISGFITPVSGEVRLDGTPLTGLAPVKRMRLGLRRSFQQELVVEDLTAWDKVLAIADHACASAAAAKAEVARAIEFAGLSEVRNVPGRRLNLFQRRMVELAKTLIGGARAILLDEPGAGLNDQETGELRMLLKSIPSEFGAQVVLIDHDAELIAAVCDETMVIDFGRRLAHGPTREVLQDAEVRRAYLGTAA